MAYQIQPLWQPAQLQTAAGVWYNALVKTRIDKITVSNPSATAGNVYTVTIAWVPSGLMFGVPFQVVTTKAIQPLESWDAWPLIGHTLGVGDTIQALASTGAVLNFFGSGTTVS